MTKFVNLAPDTRTYVAQVKARPNFQLASIAPTRETRKELAYAAQINAEQRIEKSLLPKLDALRSRGMLSSYEVIPGTGTIILNAPDDKAGAAFDALRGVSELGRIVRNREVKLDDAQARTMVDPTPKVPEYNVAKVNAPAVWAQGFNGQGVTVGLVDTGANTTHVALKDHYRGTKADGTQDHSYNFFDGVNRRPDAYDDHSHGSHVAGTSTGGTSDAIIGVAPGAKFISAKVFTAGGSGSTATILQGLGWMLAPRDRDGNNPDPSKAPDIVSNSWGSSNGAKLDYLDPFKAFDAAGIVPVVAAGNSGPGARTIGAPGSYAQSLTIGATDKDDKVASFSSRGPSAIKDANGVPLNKPDFSAPGVNVTSAGAKGDAYVTMSGTSMATPAAAGVVALLLSKYPNLKGEQVREIMAKSAVDLGTTGYDFDYGAGRIDAAAAMALADKMMTPPPAQP